MTDELEFVRLGLQDANGLADEGLTLGQVHRNRSKNFVESLAARLRTTAPEGMRVLSKHHDAHRRELGLNELLYDVLACDVGVVPSPNKIPLTFITKSLWQIESEFAEDAREALFDFNKLVLGAAPRKLFIGPQVTDTDSFLATLKPAADACSGVVYVALVTHPRRWKGEQAPSAKFWRNDPDDWVSLS